MQFCACFFLCQIMSYAVEWSYQLQLTKLNHNLILFKKFLVVIKFLSFVGNPIYDIMNDNIYNLYLHYPFKRRRVRIIMERWMHDWMNEWIDGGGEMSKKLLVAGHWLICYFIVHNIPSSFYSLHVKYIKYTKTSSIHRFSFSFLVHPTKLSKFNQPNHLNSTNQTT